MHNYNVKGIFTVQKIYIHMYIHVIKQYTPHDNDMVTWAKAEVFVPGVCVHLSAHFPMDVQTGTQLRTNTGGGGVKAGDKERYSSALADRDQTMKPKQRTWS